LAKTKAIAHLLTYATAFFAAISCHATKKRENLNVFYNKTKNPVDLKHCQTSSSYRIFYLMQLKSQKKKKIKKSIKTKKGNYAKTLANI